MHDINIETITWYHGSPLKLKKLEKGSTITPDKNLAKIFSHKPSIVSISDKGEIKHDGEKKGYLYKIAEKVNKKVIYPHPDSYMEKGKGWLTRCELKLELIKEVNIDEKVKLCSIEIKNLKEKYQ